MTGPRQRILNHAQVTRPQKIIAASEPLHNVNNTQEEKATPQREPLVQHDAKLSENPASTEVSIPTPSEAVVTPDYKGAIVLSQPALVVGRQLEMMNVFLVCKLRLE